MTKKIDRMIILSLVLASITLIALVAAQGRRIEGALKRVEALAAREEQAAEEESTLASGALAPGAEEAAPQEPEKPEGAISASSVLTGEQAFTAYAYCACEKCCGRWARYGRTASGTIPEQGRTVAADPEVIPLGTEIWIDGAGPYITEDTGAGISGRTIDVFFDSHEDALKWGKRTVQVAWEG